MNPLTRREALAAGVASAVALSVPFASGEAQERAAAEEHSPRTSVAPTTVATEQTKAALAVGCRFDRSF